MAIQEMSALAEAVAIAEELQRRKSYRKLATMFPETGPLRRELYPKHMEFFALGAKKPFRLFVGANGVGKTEGCGGVETTHHLTGDYPDYWVGHRFNRPIHAWVAGDTKDDVREITQAKLFGDVAKLGDDALGTGLVPRDSIVNFRFHQSTNRTLDWVTVKNKAGGESVVVLKSYEERRKGFQGTEQDWIWLDEEPPADIYGECVQRFRGKSADGQLIITFTPLKGISEVVSLFIPAYAQSYDEKEYEVSGRAFVMCEWGDVPHLSEEEKARKLANCLPHEREARSKGVPSLGSGKIYPVQESKVFIEPFPLPKHWPRAYGLDVGWNRTAAIWGAWDQDADTLYLYSEHYVGEAVPEIHATSIKARGSWIPGVIDPAARGRNQKDGTRLIEDYKNLGLLLHKADNEVSAGLLDCWTLMEQGRLKVFSNCTNFLQEFRLYRRDEDGKIVKHNDHLMDAFRYLVMSGRKYAKTPMVQSIEIPEMRFG